MQSVSSQAAIQSLNQSVSQSINQSNELSLINQSINPSIHRPGSWCGSGKVGTVGWLVTLVGWTLKLIKFQVCTVAKEIVSWLRLSLSQSPVLRET